MSHPSWNPSNTGGENFGQVTARRETTPSFGISSISMSQQQEPKKFAPVVAPKPKFNPYKQLEEAGYIEAGGDFLPPPPPIEDLDNLPSPPGTFPLPPPPTDGALFNVQVRTPEKSLQERRSSLDAEIDSLTSILADLENSSPYKPRPQQLSGAQLNAMTCGFVCFLMRLVICLRMYIEMLQTSLGAPNYGGTLSNTSTLSTPVTGHKRMVIPTQPPLTATKRSAAKPQPATGPSAPAAGIVVPKPQSMPHPVPASYTTASTPTRPTFNVQVKSAQPSPHYMPPGPQGLSPAYNQQYPQQPSRSPGPVQYMPTQPRSPDFAYGPPQPSRQPEPMASHAPPPPRAYYEPQYPGGVGQGAAYGAQNTWRPEPAYPTSATSGPGYQPPGPRKTYITDPPPAMAPAPMAQYGAAPGMQQKGGSIPPVPPGPVPSHTAARPEDELERLTKKMLYDMEHPPSEEYFAALSLPSTHMHARSHGHATHTPLPRLREDRLMLCDISSDRLPNTGKTEALTLEMSLKQRDGCRVKHPVTLIVFVSLGPLKASDLYGWVTGGLKELSMLGRCSRCSENVVGEGSGCTAMDQVFHVECFTCMTCSRKLRGQPFYAVEKKAYCEPCYTNTLEQCNICKTPIMERILRATGKAYHPHCFTCVECHRSLDGIPFTVDAGNHIHCIEDFHKKFAPRCSVCKEPIMPANGQEETVRIVALDRDFHVQCYRCEDCGSLLSEGDNQGCYPLDGHILCKTCNTERIQTLTAKASTDL
ncbi:LPP protein, partial [Polyodon spathula]|nr:LPP protein [Polyodon spathula]